MGPAPGAENNSGENVLLPRFPSDDEPGSPSPFRCVTDFDFAHASPVPAVDAASQPQGSGGNTHRPANIGRTQYVYVPVPVPVPVIQQHSYHVQEFPQCKDEDHCSQKIDIAAGRLEQWEW